MAERYHNPKYWTCKEEYLGTPEGGLRAEECPKCGLVIFPRRDVCPDCGGHAKTEKELSGKGEVYSYTTVNDPPAGYEEFAPYMMALVRLEEGPLVVTQLTDVGQTPIKIGTPVEMVTRVQKKEGEKGMIIYCYKFRPVLKVSAQPQQQEM